MSLHITTFVKKPCKEHCVVLSKAKMQYRKAYLCLLLLNAKETKNLEQN